MRTDGLSVCAANRLLVFGCHVGVGIGVLVVFGRQRGVASLVTCWVLACQNANNRSPVPADAHLELPFIMEVGSPFNGDARINVILSS